MRILVGSKGWKELNNKTELTVSANMIFGSPVELDIIDPTIDLLPAGILDYDVTIIDTSDDLDKSNIEELGQQLPLALRQGRIIICLAGCDDPPCYEWLRPIGVGIEYSSGKQVQAVLGGRAKAFLDYFREVDEYSIVCGQRGQQLQPLEVRSLAVIRGTELPIAARFIFGRGSLFMLPPPRTRDFASWTPTMGVAKHCHDQTPTIASVGDEPDWLEPVKTARHVELATSIEKLSREKDELDRIAYLLYGTGKPLEESVSLAFKAMGLVVTATEPGATIDLVVKCDTDATNLAIEVTGVSDKIRKQSPKMSQAWTYFLDQETEDQKLVLIANTYNGLPLDERKHREHFTADVIRKFSRNKGLLMTAHELYLLWKDIYEGRLPSEEARTLLREQIGKYEAPKT